MATPDPALWADATRQRVLRALGARERPTALAELAAEVGGHPNTTRAYLKALQAAGLVERQADAALGPGRPSWLHSLTYVGRSVVRRLDEGEEEFDSDSLAHAFVRHVAAGPDPSGVAQAVGKEWGTSFGRKTRARSRAGRTRAVKEVFDRLGFTPVAVERDRADAPAGGADVDELVLHSCPLLAAATEHPEVVCAVHQGMVDGLLEQTGGTGRVELEPWGAANGCRLKLLWDERTAD